MLGVINPMYYVPKFPTERRICPERRNDMSTAALIYSFRATFNL